MDVDRPEESDPLAKKPKRSRWGQVPRVPAAQSSASVGDPGIADGTATRREALASASQQDSDVGASSGRVGAAVGVVPFDVSSAKAAMAEALRKAKEAVMQKEVLQQKLLAASTTQIQTGSSSVHHPLGISPETYALQLQHARVQAQAQLQASLHHQLLFKQGKMEPLRLDELGREVDESGKVVEVKRHIRSTLKVNINREKDIQPKPSLHPRRPDKGLQDPSINPFFDANVRTAKKMRKGFNFIEEGTFVQKERHLQRRADVVASGLDPAQLHSERMAARTRGMNETNDNPNLIPLGGVKDESESDVEKEEGNNNTAKEEEEEDGSIIHEAAADDITTNNSKIVTSSSSKRAAGILSDLRNRSRRIIPEVEWWDRVFLKTNNSKDNNIGTGDDDCTTILMCSSSSTDTDITTAAGWSLDSKAITVYIQHPIPIKGITSLSSGKTGVATSTIFLTPKERKKLRRRKRQEIEKEKQDKIKMGLMPPPPPKIKLSNLMRVLGNDAVSDPSRIERQVRSQMEKRLKDHQARNKARRLPPEERRLKKVNKWLVKNSTTGITAATNSHTGTAPTIDSALFNSSSSSALNNGEFDIALFLIRDLENRKSVYKIDINAQQYHLTGACVICPNVINAVYVEGLSRSVKRFSWLMQRRIKWDATAEDDDRDVEECEEPDDEGTNTEGDKKKITEFCSVVWRGVGKVRHFKAWKVHRVRTELEGRKIFSDRQIEDFWDQLRKYRNPILDA